jgi:hypothetical protein
MAIKFPNPAERSEKDPAALCKNTRVVALYNTYHPGENAKRVSQKIRSWFLETARKEGWDSAIFVNDVETRHSAGCLLLKKMNKIEINLFVSGDVEDEKKKPAKLLLEAKKLPKLKKRNR